MMKNLIFVLIVFLAGSGSCKTSRPAANAIPPAVKQESPVNTTSEVNFSEPSTWILGYFEPNRLRQAPYSEWYTTGYDDYVFNPEAIDKLRKIEKADITIKIVMGIWCSDSRREVPRFMRVLNASDFPPDKVILIGVDREKNSPVGDFGSLNIERVPTFIIYKNNLETGRIIETPTTSLEQDMINILTRNE
jgi:hypothetical protein